MKIDLKSCVAFSVLVFSSAVAFSGQGGQCNYLYPAGTAPAITNKLEVVNTQELCSNEYVVMYSGITRGPLWSAEHLTQKQLSSGPKRVNSFHVDDRINIDDRAELDDFDGSGYDRGHMAPSGDASNRQAQFQTFLLSNMVPQNPDENRHLHQRIETAVRAMVKEKGEFYVITGPLFVGSKIAQLNGRVAIPTHIFKLVYDPINNAAAAYVEKNEAGHNYEIVSVAQLGKMAGIDFLPGVGSVNWLELPKPASENEVASLDNLQFEPGVNVIHLHKAGNITRDKTGLKQVNLLINKLMEIKSLLDRDAAYLPEHIRYAEKTIIHNPFE